MHLNVLRIPVLPPPGGRRHFGRIIRTGNLPALGIEFNGGKFKQNYRYYTISFCITSPCRKHNYMKILYVTTVGQTMGFFTAFITELVQQGHAVDIACSGIESVPRQYTELGCKIFRLSCARSPFKSGNLLAIKEIKRIVESGKYNIVHCHTPVAAALTRIVCKTLRQKGLKVIYTAHGFHFYKGAPLLNWLFYYPIERFLARFTDVLITINNEDHEIAQTFKAQQVKYVPGVGVDIGKFTATSSKRTAGRAELGIGEDQTVFVSVGELNKGKTIMLLYEPSPPVF